MCTCRWFIGVSNSDWWGLVIPLIPWVNAMYTATHPVCLDEFKRLHGIQFYSSVPRVRL